MTTLSILVPVDGSENANRAIDYIIKLMDCGAQVEIHLVYVNIPVASVHVKLFFGQEELNNYYREEGIKNLQKARDKLDSSTISYHYHIGVGHVAETILAYASKNACDQIVMGTRGASAIGNLIIGSVATQVLHLSELPVTLVK
jgi:nucleotide-binding universal stress UspA family protein